eukprot:392295-Prymnesium_polylepis.1
MWKAWQAQACACPYPDRPVGQTALKREERRTFGSRRRWRPSRRAQRGAACDRPSALRAFG